MVLIGDSGCVYCKTELQYSSYDIQYVLNSIFLLSGVFGCSWTTNGAGRRTS